MQADQNLRNDMPYFKSIAEPRTLKELGNFTLKAQEKDFSETELKGPVRGLHVQRIIDDLKGAINTNIITNLNGIIKEEYDLIKELTEKIGDTDSGLIKSLNDLRTELTLPPAAPSFPVVGEENLLL